MGRTTIHYGADHSQVSDLWLPAQPDGDVPVVVLIHGGFWRAPFTKALMGRLARSVMDKGWAAWNIEYRRLGVLGGGGGWPATFVDVAAAIDRLAAVPEIDADRVATCGHSAGGTLALWAAGRHRLPPGTPGAEVEVTVAAVVSLAGIADLEDADEAGVGGDAVERLLGGNRGDVPDRYRAASPAALLPLGTPQVLIHGLADTTVPPSMSETYVTAARAAGDDARYIGLADVGHREVIDPRSPAWQQALVALEATFTP